MLSRLLFKLSESGTARRISMNAPGARSMARRFVAGETLDDGIAAARALVRSGFTVSLDYLGESVKSREEARAASDMYMRLLERIGSDPELRDKVNVSVKLTQMGQDIVVGGGAITDDSHPRWPRPDKHATPENRKNWDEAFLRENVFRFLDVAQQNGTFVRFDMEGTPHTQRTLDFFRSLWDNGRQNIGVVLQSCLLRSMHDVKQANLLGARVRLCKGAYREPPEYAYQEKREVDANYVALMKVLLSDGNYPGIATHDEAMLDATREHAGRHDIAPSAFEFQMLYGVRRDLQTQLLAQGYNVRIYVPFGEAWYPYLMRRMAERPANMFFVVNAVLKESPLGFLFGSAKK
ncbi:MAG TPA: proline dehydrogenase family protein [Longimicrobiales bacterium]|nr:proline dehydrogenase family protein [Longimicrobiales bacterium]